MFRYNQTKTVKNKMDIVHTISEKFPFFTWIWTFIWNPVFYLRNWLFPQQFQVAITDIWNNDATVYFKVKLKKLLKCNNYILNEIQDSNKFLRTNEGPLFVICLHESRIGADIKAALSDIDKEYSNKVILIIIHWKQDDTEPEGSNYEDRVKHIIEYYLQNDSDNMQRITDKIVEILTAYDRNVI